jgi:hypothetical protein
MKLPFTIEQCLVVFRQYNESVYHLIVLLAPLIKQKQVCKNRPGPTLIKVQFEDLARLVCSRFSNGRN